jgi:protocatechuate 3,4-dioxygenase beta subunit
VVIALSAAVAAAAAQGQAQTQTQGGQAGGGRGAAAPQQPVRGAQAQATTPATGVIAGMVTSQGTGTPVRRARVTLNAPELRGGRSTLTDDKGQFSFIALPAGRFTLTASKPGYVDVPYGAKKPGRPGTPIQLAAGQKMDRASIVLPKGGVITGIVVDDSGEPAPGTQVRAMRYVMRTGERTLQQAGQAQTDDRGIYRIYGLQPGDYLVSAVPRNLNAGDIRQTIAAEIEALMQQLQGAAALAGRGGGQAGGQGGGPGGAGGGGRGGGRGGVAAVAGIDIAQLMGGGRGGGDLMARAQQLQEQLAQQDAVQQVAYAPVYYPGTPMPSTASSVTIAIAEERGGVDFRLALVPTAKIEGTIALQGTTTLPQNTMISLLPLDQNGPAQVPGLNSNNTRMGQDGRFRFDNIPPGQYRVMARGVVRETPAAGAANAAAQGGRQGRGGQGGQGGRGGPGQIQQVLWGSADINVNGDDVSNITISLQPGMTVTGRVSFDGAGAPPADLSVIRVNLQPRGAQQGFDMGGIPPAEVDATGRFTIKGVLPGRYTLNANIPAGGRGAQFGGGGGGRGGAGVAGGVASGSSQAAAPTVQWTMKSALAQGRDALDFGLVVEPNQDVNGATITFTDKTQEVTGTIQDVSGAPTADYTIIIFAGDKNYWVPQARRIQSVRPGTDGRFTFRQLPAGDYRLTAVTDVEPGEWYDPAFLEQLVSVSIPVLLRDGEKKTQDIKVAGGF